MARKPEQTLRSVTYRLPESLLDQLDKLCQETRRTYTAEVCIALESHLRKHKLWPIEADEDED